MTDRFTATIDAIASLFLGLVALLTFAEAMLRYFFAAQIPDAFALACVAQGIAMLWGIASTTYNGKHIAVDALWEACGPRAQRWIDNFANAFNAIFFFVFAWMLARKVGATYGTSEATTELALPLWPFYLAAWLGVVAAAILSLIRLRRMWVHPPVTAHG